MAGGRDKSIEGRQLGWTQVLGAEVGVAGGRDSGHAGNSSGDRFGAVSDDQILSAYRLLAPDRYVGTTTLNCDGKVVGFESYELVAQSW